MLPLVLAALAGAPPPAEIFRRAQDAWQHRAIPVYQSFTVPCDLTDYAQECQAGDDARFTVRMSDGRTYAQSVPKTDAPPKVLVRGGFIFGPGGAPLGFYRHVGVIAASPPPNLAPDPLLRTIATVSAVAHTYDIALAGEDVIGGHECYHLTLRTSLDHDKFPLSDLWVDEASFEIRALTYDWNFDDGHRGEVHYVFAPVGPAAFWAIVHIDAKVAAVHGFLRTRIDRVGSDMADIAFPTTQPDDEFVPPP